MSKGERVTFTKCFVASKGKPVEAGPGTFEMETNPVKLERATQEQTGMG